MTIVTTPVTRATLVGCLLVVAAGVMLAATGWSTPLQVGGDTPITAMDERSGPANNSPDLLVDPVQPRFVVLANRLDAPDFGCALQVSGDRGKSWVSAVPVPELPEGAEKCYAPEVAFDPSGKLYYLFVGLQGEGNHPMGAFLTTSTDYGATFTAPRRVLGEHNFAVRMAIDRTLGRQGRLHLVWIHADEDPPLGGFQASPNPIMSAHSDDGGITFSKPVQINDPNRPRAVAPALALGRHHQVWVTYFDLGDDRRDYQGLEGPVWDGTWSLATAKSDDAGDHFTPASVVDDHIVPPERVMLIFTMPPPSLAVRGGLACVAWTDARFGDADAVTRCSSDDSRHWTALRRMNDDAVGNGRRQYLPRLALSTGGRLNAIFLDRRSDPLNILNSVMYTYSTDGGRHFARNVKLNTAVSPATIGQQYGNVSAKGQYEFGARLGLVPVGRSVIAAWVDTRNTFRGKGQDIFVANVQPPLGSGARVAVGGVLAVAGLAVALDTLWRGRRGRTPARAEPGTA